MPPPQPLAPAAARAISERIEITRILLIIGVVVLHCPPYVSLEAPRENLFDLAKAIVQHGLFRATVPALSLISGYLFFTSYSLDKRFTAVLAKARSLVVPMLFWNAMLLAVAWQVEPAAPAERFADLETVLNELFAITAAPINYPTIFLRDLFVLACLGWAFFALLEMTPLGGLGIVLVIFILDADGWLILNGNIAVNFYLGGLIRKRNIDVTLLDRYRYVSLLAWVALSVLWVVLRLPNRTVLALVTPYLIWSALALVQPSRLAAPLLSLAPSSFAIFMLHAPILAACWIVYRRIDPDGAFYPAFWMLAPVLTVAGATAARAAMLATVPSFAPVAFGNR